MNTSFSRAALLRVAGATMMTAAALTAGLPAPAQAAPAAPGERSVTYQVVNDTDLRLQLTDSEVSEGHWTARPTRLIKPDKTGSFGTESTENRGGTAGSVTYKTTYGEIVIRWDNPWLEDSDFDCETPTGISCQMDGNDPQARTPDITVTLS
jgi:hypothetical protein